MTSTEKKESFRKYLETSGVIESITKALVALYENNDKPPKAIDFFKSQLGSPTPAEFEALLAEKDTLAKELEAAKRRIEELEAAAGGAGEPESTKKK